MPTRVIFAALAAAAIIVGGILLLDRTSTPTNRGGAAPEVTSRSEENPSTTAEPRTVPAGWQRYEQESLLFTLDYPAGWTYRVEAEEHPTVSFMPPSPALQEVELNPRIILKLVPLVNVFGTYDSSAAWFDAEVVKNQERWDARADALYGNPRYAFTEGIGEYPHENIIIVRGATAYWFSIEASDPAIHELLPQLAASLQFRQ